MSFNPDGFDYRFMTEEIKTKGHEKLLDELFKELDCSRYIENVGYPITYNSFAYDRTCWKFNYVLDDGIAIRGASVKNSKDKIKNWL